MDATPFAMVSWGLNPYLNSKRALFARWALFIGCSARFVALETLLVRKINTLAVVLAAIFGSSTCEYPLRIGAGQSESPRCRPIQEHPGWELRVAD
jgi:hypothetical protein